MLESEGDLPHSFLGWLPGSNASSWMIKGAGGVCGLWTGNFVFVNSFNQIEVLIHVILLTDETLVPALYTQCNLPGVELFYVWNLKEVLHALE